ncbi:RNA-binding protein squid-like [Schistocerca cancellata]|uniref:RNA-binding protein squid-like n=1 Tax=Schistocerca cancellata TaxID=274614 RepID=UPI002118DBA8|nr:RNA-binding protein squid-like [Schistocerca cancellata]
MAENQEYEMGNGEYQQDGGEKKFQFDVQQQQQQVNGEGEGTDEAGGGGGDAPADSGSTEAPGRDDDRKLFVGGLSWETTDKELREHFQTYGEIESIIVKTDPSTSRSRGFAFIVFSQAESIDKVFSARDHIINNKKVDP